MTTNKEIYKKLIHRLAHLTGWNYGSVISKMDEHGNIWSAFECAGCGKIQGKHIIGHYRRKLADSTRGDK